MMPKMAPDAPALRALSEYASDVADPRTPAPKYSMRNRTLPYRCSIAPPNKMSPTILSARWMNPMWTNVAVVSRHHCDAGRIPGNAPNRYRVRFDVGEPV